MGGNGTGTGDERKDRYCNGTINGEKGQEQNGWRFAVGVPWLAVCAVGGLRGWWFARLAVCAVSGLRG